MLAIVGAGMIPLAIMIGSGVDISRAYMAKSRMQSACDAASLAARRVMRNDSFTSEVEKTGKEFFAFNYPAGIYGTETFAPVITKPQAGVVRVTAASRIPTAVMNLFGFRTLPVEVSCNASLNFVNTDIVLVLDVTGSMNDSVGGSVKIQALRDAVMALYDELAPVQAQLRAQGQRLRYSIVPYSSTVNVGRLLYAQNPSYLRTTVRVPSRLANFTQPFRYGPYTLYRHNNWTYRDVDYDVTEYIKPSGKLIFAKDATGAVLASNSYNPQQLATAVYDGNIASSAWNGCIEERDTTNSIDGGSNLTIPAAAKDLNINLIPSDNSSRWRPMVPDLVYRRSTGSSTENYGGGATDTRLAIKEYDISSGYWACPDEARRLAEWDRSSLNTYLQKLTPVGGTYHDIGMIWGARFASTGGVFADACQTYAGMPCNRHVIFMTDGAQTAYCNVYSAYGVERNDMRVRGSTNCSSDDQNNAITASLLKRHEQRFRMACNATKNLGASVWVIGFDTSLNSNLIDCATNAGQADTATNRDALIAKFRAIGNKIGALRLTQ